MQKKSFCTMALLVMMCCFALFLSGCNADNSQIQATPPSNETQTPDSPTPTPTQASLPTETVTPSVELQTPDLITPTPTALPAETSTPNLELQTPGSTSTNQIDSTKSEHVATLETGLDDGTEVKLIVSGQELVKHWAVIVDGEALVPDFTSVFGKLKNARGNESAGFWSLSFTDTNSNIETVVIENSQYSIKIVEGEYSFTCNDESIPLTVPAQKINGHIMLPLKAIAEAISATIEWDEAAKAISFFY